MDHTLTCNNLKCRKELTDRALVTTCSHIFCVDCANRLLLTTNDGPRKICGCPACGSQLSTPGDATMTNLKPSEEYKSSVLSGFPPSTIMECAGRALSFWAYQTTQDIYFQQHLYKTLTEKYSALSTRLEKTVTDANSEIDVLQRKLNDLVTEHDILRRKNNELAKAFTGKSQRLIQTQELYDKVKRKAEMYHIERAACDAVDSTIHSVPGALAHFPAIASNSVHADQQSRSPIFGYGNHLYPTWSDSLDRDLNGSASWQRSSLIFPTGHEPPVLDQVQGSRNEPYINRCRQEEIPVTPGVLDAGQRGATPANNSRFGHNRAGLAGIGLSSGIKVSGPTNIASIGAPNRGH